LFRNVRIVLRFYVQRFQKGEGSGVPMPKKGSIVTIWHVKMGLDLGCFLNFTQKTKISEGPTYGIEVADENYGKIAAIEPNSCKDDGGC